METEQTVLKGHIVNKNILIINIIFFVLIFKVYSQKNIIIPELINGRLVIDDIELVNCNSSNLIGMGLYTFTVLKTGDVDSVFSISNFGIISDSLMKCSLKKLKFKPLTRKNKIFKFQLKIYSVNITSKDYKIGLQIEDAIVNLRNSEINYYFKDNDLSKEKFLIKGNIILLPPLISKSIP